MSEPLFPTRISVAELRRAVAKTAATLLARYWPASGGRDEAALSLAWWLVKSGWTDDGAERFTTSIRQPRI
jgi:hypothetical protein